MVLLILQEKLTDSNFTLGALSLESGLEFGKDDPLIGATALDTPTSIADDSCSSFGQRLYEQEEQLHDYQSLDDPDYDLGFYFESKALLDGEDTTAESLSESENIDHLTEELETRLEDMIQTAQMHPRSLQVRPLHKLFTSNSHFFLTASYIVRISVGNFVFRSN